MLIKHYSGTPWARCHSSVLSNSQIISFSWICPASFSTYVNSKPPCLSSQLLIMWRTTSSLFIFILTPTSFMWWPLLLVLEVTVNNLSLSTLSTLLVILQIAILFLHSSLSCRSKTSHSYYAYVVISLMPLILLEDRSLSRQDAFSISHRIAEVGSNLWRPSSPTSLLTVGSVRAGCSGQI